MKQAFESLGEFLFNELKGNEELNLNLNGEQSTYLRFNKAQVRQNTFVDQKFLSISYQNEGRKVSFDLTLTGQREVDRQNARFLLDRSRAETQVLPADPFLVPMENRGQSSKIHEGKLLPAADAIHSIADTAAGSDFVGFYAAGPVFRGNLNSKGQKHWFSTNSFFIDYSLFTTNADGENKAVKGVYADTDWDSQKFKIRMQGSLDQLRPLSRKSTSLKPGSYRVFLAPGAVAEMTGMLSWNALSYSAMKKGNCAFRKLYDKEKTLSPLFSLKENFALGLCPQFNSIGEVSAETLPLVQEGILTNMLISARAEKEYGVKSNGSDQGGWGFEYLRSPEISAGSLAEKDVLNKLGTGLFLSNLHYLNWSDEAHARITGMTRYACFWVENGEVVGPIKDLRFDDSLFNILGSELESVTKEQHIDPAISTYFQRELGGKKVPGMMIQKMSFTL